MAEPLADPTIVASTPRCIQCAYDIASLKSPGRCPECGLPFGVSIVVSGIARVSHGMPVYRMIAWTITIIATSALTMGWAFLLFVSPAVLAVTVVGTAGGLFVLFLTGPRERRGKEQFVLTTHGVGRLPIPKIGQSAPFRESEADFTPWKSVNAVRLDRVSGVWYRIRIGCATENETKMQAIEFDAGIRCPQAVWSQLHRAMEAVVIHKDNSEQVAHQFFASSDNPPPIPPL